MTVPIGIRNQSPNEVFVVGNLVEDINHERGQTYHQGSLQQEPDFTTMSVPTPTTLNTRKSHMW